MAKREAESVLVLEEEEEEEEEDSSDYLLLQKSRCCFCFPSTTGIAFWGTTSSHQISSSKDDSIWSRAFQKIRGWSEIFAGPRWKTFIRRFNRNKSGGGGGGGGGKFQYDPLSYALNFDEGPDEEQDYLRFRDFSTRYAASSATPPPSTLDVIHHRDVAAFG